MEENEAATDQIELTDPEYVQPTLQYYADINQSDNISGFYLNEIHGDNIPETALPITFEEWQLYSANANLYKLEGETFREKTQQEVDDEIASLPVAPESTEQKVVRLEEENVATMLAVAEVYESSEMKNTEREQETVDTMLALTEAYGLVVEQQTTIAAQQTAIEALTARLDNLEAQGGA